MALDMGKQVGPLPMGAWVVVVGAGLGFAFWSRSNTSGGTAPTTTTRDTTTDPLTGEDATGTGPGWVAVPPPSSTPGSATYPDNDAWGNAAINWLISRGMDPALSQNAIAHALQGDTMSVREFALWSLAIGALGSPPYSVVVQPPTSVGDPVTPTATPPQSPAAPSPQAGKWVWVTSKDTLHTTAVKAYGPGSNRWQDIYNANKQGVRRPDGIAPNITGGMGWLSSDYAGHPGLNFHTSGRWLFAPR